MRSTAHTSLRAHLAARQLLDRERRRDEQPAQSRAPAYEGELNEISLHNTRLRHAKMKPAKRRICIFPAECRGRALAGTFELVSVENVHEGIAEI
jgi:hypothetical protein